MEEKRDTQGWLNELSSQSWNLELVVSGAAIFSTSFLPELTDQAINYYYENFQPNNSFLAFSLPTLAYGLLKAAAIILIATFAVHFIFRSFWISLVGLRAVFPNGINYENLPNTNQLLRERYQKIFGSFDEYIIRLDKKCSQIFAVAFALVLFILAIAFVYIFIFLLIIAFQTYNNSLFLRIKDKVMLALGVIFFLYFFILFLGANKRYNEQPVIRNLFNKIVIANQWMFMGLYKPINYINFIFASNLPRKRYYTAATFLALTFYILAFYFFTKKLTEDRNISLLEPRSFYSKGSEKYALNANFYDNQRPEEAGVERASIQSDIIEEPFIKLFINYNKPLDADLAKICKQPTFPEKIEKKEKRLLEDKAQLACLTEYFQVELNDSTLKQPVEFFYEEDGKEKTKGLRAYLATDQCKIGRNTLSIKKLAVDSLPKKVWRDYTTIPFWFAKD